MNKLPKDFNIVIGSLVTLSDIVSISNTQIQVLTPSKPVNASAAITLYMNGKSATSTGFAYSDSLTVTITGLDMMSSSPVKKRLLTITGTNFGTIRNDLKVQLVQIDGPNLYELNIPQDGNGVTYLTDTQIKAMLGGGRSGQYRVRV